MTDDRFRALSETLTGHTDLPAFLATRLWERIVARFPRPVIDELLAVHDRLPSDPDQRELLLQRELGQRPELSELAAEINRVWYTGELRAADGEILGPRDPSEYFEGLIWKTVRAHPPGLSGGYFGYWKYPPEN